MKEFERGRIKILRHLEEETGDLGQERDGDVLESEIGLIREVYAPQIACRYGEDQKQLVRLITSDTIRAKSTAELLKVELQNSHQIPSIIDVDPRTQALQHGQYKQGVKTDHPLVARAQQIYVQETFFEDNPWYRHGSSVGADGCSYPELEQIFEKAGENQVELSLRFYSFISDLLDNARGGELIVLSTHYVTLSRLLSLEHIASSLDNFQAPFYQADGRMYQREWDAGFELMGDLKFKEFFKQHQFIFDLDLDQVDRIRNGVISDLELLKAQYMQRYGEEPREN